MMMKMKQAYNLMLDSFSSMICNTCGRSYDKKLDYDKEITSPRMLCMECGREVQSED